MTGAEKVQWMRDADHAEEQRLRTTPERRWPLGPAWLGEAPALDWTRTPYLPPGHQASWKRGVWA